jgi:hypothetical protein
MNQTINQCLRSQDDINSEILRKIPTGVNFGDMPMGPYPSEQDLMSQLQRWAHDATVDGGAFNILEKARGLEPPTKKKGLRRLVSCDRAGEYSSKSRMV